MWKYIGKRLLISIPLIFGVVTLTFFLVHIAPGDPTDIFYNPDMGPQARELVRKSFGLDKPLHIQYGKWIVSCAKLDFGVSFSAKRPVKDILKETIPNTVQLSFAALLLDLILGIAIGTLAAVRQYSKFDNFTTVTALTIYSTPEFWLGLMLILIFSGILGWLPASGMIDIVRYEQMNFLGKIFDRLRHLVLPAFCLGVGSAAATARYMRGSLLEVIRQDYIRTARAKGLSEGKVIFKHALRAALIPMVTLIGLSLPFLFSGAVIIENVFGWPGMGRVGVDAVFSRDYPVIMAENLIFAIMVIAGNLVSDILYAVVDPRVRYK
ncbi:MAG: ABC transporter permease [Candidatus Omnitrophica bacterium]|nr:ABC transporter permease [Candidatus Omnitrophota bacterium]